MVVAATAAAIAAVLGAVVAFAGAQFAVLPTPFLDIPNLIVDNILVAVALTADADAAAALEAVVSPFVETVLIQKCSSLPASAAAVALAAVQAWVLQQQH